MVVSGASRTTYFAGVMLSSLYEGKVRDPGKAFARYLSAFVLSPADEQTTVDVERAAKATGQWQEVQVAWDTC